MLPSPALLQTPPSASSSTLTPEDDVRKGLIHDLNIVLRQSQWHEPVDEVEQQAQDLEAPPSHSSPKPANTEECEDREHRGREPALNDLPVTLSPTLPLDHVPHTPQDTRAWDSSAILDPLVAGEARHQEEERANAAASGTIAEVTGNGETEPREKVPDLAQPIPKHVEDVWEVQSSPEPSKQRGQGTKESVKKSPRNLLTAQQALPAGTQPTGTKRKRGRPRKRLLSIASEVKTLVAGTGSPATGRHDSAATKASRSNNAVTHADDSHNGGPRDEDQPMVVHVDLDGIEKVESVFSSGSDSEGSTDKAEDTTAKARFDRDVDRYIGRLSFHPPCQDLFTAPRADAFTAARITHEPLSQLCKILSAARGTGKGDGHSQRGESGEVESRPARAFLRVLSKLDRFFQAAPKFPDLQGQNAFLGRHANMLNTYFYKIEVILKHIRTQRLEIPEHNGSVANSDPGKGEKIARDLVLYVIPMMSRVLASAWALGGEPQDHGLFTRAVVELMKRVIDWMIVLRDPVLEELRRRSLDETTTKCKDQTWQVWNDEKEEIGRLLDWLLKDIAAALDRLGKGEDHAKQYLHRGQPQTQSKDQLRMSQKAAGAKETGLASTAERRKDSSMPARGVQYDPDSSASSSRPSPFLTPVSTHWSLEEKTYLFKKIQEAFPRPPDIDRLRSELNKSRAETAIVAEDILEKMLAIVKPRQPVSERQAEAHRIICGL
ncbi:hypothetical protein F5Y17DRAFT_428784 [Xylariaceae sp. FL0594]|nr:hypothetical protein F5Y17DRAFT_428784 [Xylariaceae sp. FL0594]